MSSRFLSSFRGHSDCCVGSNNELVLDREDEDYHFGCDMDLFDGFRSPRPVLECMEAVDSTTQEGWRNTSQQNREDAFQRWLGVFHRRVSALGSVSVISPNRLLRFLSNLTATVFILINLNPVMSVIFNVPSVIASSVRA
jgi:hypothetical protein